MHNLMTSLTRLKERYSAAMSKASTLKSKHAIDTNSLKIINARSAFIALIENNIGKFNHHDFTKCCIMPPIGGPVPVSRYSEINYSRTMGATIQVTIDGAVGYIDLLDNPCGFDNLKVLTTQILRQHDNRQ